MLAVQCQGLVSKGGFLSLAFATKEANDFLKLELSLSCIDFVAFLHMIKSKNGLKNGTKARQIK